MKPTTDELMQPINIRVSPVVKASLEHEANLKGVSVSELVRRKLSPDESRVPETDYSFQTMPRIEGDLQTSEKYLAALLEERSSDIPELIARLNIQRLSTLGLTLSINYGEPLEDDYKFYIDQVVSRQHEFLCIQVSGRVRALRACKLMLEIIHELAKQHRVSGDNLAKFLRQVPYQYPEFGMG